jgi:hypothetical protein
MEEDYGAPLPALSWFVHSLVDNVGKVEWVKMTSEEQEEFTKRTGSTYPYKVVTHPIREGRNIFLESGVEIKCDSEKTKNLIISMARKLDALDKENQYLHAEGRASQWKNISELSPHQPFYSWPDYYPAIVDSPLLHYLGGVTLGFRTKEKWYIFCRGKTIEHPVTHYRELPPHAEPTVPYECIKEEVEQLRKFSDSV